jgi:MoaA/NifB/PqqE/SkfB family radical SAM enzyme
VYKELEKIKSMIAGGNTVQAITALENLKTQNSRDESVLFELGKLYLIENNLADAIKNLSQALSASHNIYAVELLAKAYKFKLQYAKALRLLYSIKNSAISGTNEEIISIFIAKERYDLAIKFIHSALGGVYDNKAEVLEYFKSQLSLLNANGQTKKVKKYINNVFSLLDKNNKKYFNHILNELEIAQREIVLKSYPTMLTVSLISACNLRCVMCPYNKQQKTQLSRHQVKQILQLFPYIEKIEWNGGEVFLYKNFNLLLEKAHQNNIGQYITSNGLLINDSYAKQIVQYGIDLTLSIDSVDKKLYESIRKGANFDLLLKNIKLINKYYKEYNKPSMLSLNAVLSKWNFQKENNFFDILVFAKENNFKEVRISIDKYETDENLLKNMIQSFNQTLPALREYAINNAILFLAIVPETYKCKEGTVPVVINEEVLQNEITLNCNFDDAKPEFKIDSAKIKHNAPLGCLLPFKKMIISFNGEFKPECVCDDFLSKIAKGRIIFLALENLKYRIFSLLSKFKNGFIFNWQHKYKTKNEYYPLPSYTTITKAWNSTEIQQMRYKVYTGELKCLNYCYLPERIKQNI